MCFEDRRRRNRAELVCECREVRSDRDWDNRNRRNNNRDVVTRKKADGKKGESGSLFLFTDLYDIQFV